MPYIIVEIGAEEKLLEADQQGNVVFSKYSVLKDYWEHFRNVGIVGVGEGSKIISADSDYTPSSSFIKLLGRDLFIAGFDLRII